MKSWMLALALAGWTVGGFAQPAGFAVEGISSVTIPVSINKMTNIIFPEGIQTGVKISRDVLAQKVKGVENVIELKAVRRDFVPTNLSVYGRDGRLYSFVLRYVADTGVLNFRVLPGGPVGAGRTGDAASGAFAGDGSAGSAAGAAAMAGINGPARVMLSGLPVDAVRLREDASRLVGRKGFLHVTARSERLRFRLKGVYVRDSLEWLVFGVRNGSAVGFRTSYARFFLQDRKRVKRRAIQEQSVMPLFDGVPSVVAGTQGIGFAEGFEPFTVPRGKRLVVQLAGKDGRMVEMRVKGRVILRGLPI